MDTCHECKDIVEKLNEEFDTLQDENIELKRKIKSLESPKVYCKNNQEWKDKYDLFKDNLDKEFDNISKRSNNPDRCWERYQVYHYINQVQETTGIDQGHNVENDGGVWLEIQPILLKELNKLTNNNGMEWCEKLSNSMCLSIEAVLNCEYISDGLTNLYTKENIIQIILNIMSQCTINNSIIDQIVVIGDN